MKLSTDEIKAILPHREPFLLVDEVLELDDHERIVALKRVRAEEYFFKGHFPGAPVMPGVLIVEALAQAGAILLLREIPDRESKLVFFVGIDRARFRQPVLPGDDLRLEVVPLSWRTSLAKMEGKAYVGDKLAAEAVLFASVVDRERAQAKAKE